MSNPTAFLRAASATRRSLRASVLRSFPRFPPTRAKEGHRQRLARVTSRNGSRADQVPADDRSDSLAGRAGVRDRLGRLRSSSRLRNRGGACWACWTAGWRDAERTCELSRSGRIRCMWTRRLDAVEASSRAERRALGYLGEVLVEKHPGDELLARSDADLVVEALGVVLDRVRREDQRLGDLDAR